MTEPNQLDRLRDAALTTFIRSHATADVARSVPARPLGKAPHKSIGAPKLGSLALPTPPAAIPLPAGWGDRAWGQRLNARLGDCTCAAIGHAVQAWTTAAGAPVTPTDADVESLYERACGYRPGVASTDTGGIMSDVLATMTRTGMGGHRIAGFVSVDPRDTEQLMTAAHLFGGLYLGFQLPGSVQTATDTWAVDAKAYPAGQSAPGSWGGHAVFGLRAYDDHFLHLVSWGTVWRVSWWFVHLYADECYAMVSEDQLDRLGRNPQGLDLPTLTADLAALKSRLTA